VEQVRVSRGIGIYFQSLRNCRVLRGITTEDTEFRGVLLQIWFFLRVIPRTLWWFFFKIKQVDDNPTIGIVLCSEKNDTMVKYSVLSDNDRLFSAKYMTWLPTEKELRKEFERERLMIERTLGENDGKR
jgi:hypothetical protein